MHKSVATISDPAHIAIKPVRVCVPRNPPSARTTEAEPLARGFAPLLVALGQPWPSHEHQLNEPKEAGSIRRLG
jgi:hypothetical protein